MSVRSAWIDSAAFAALVCKPVPALDASGAQQVIDRFLAQVSMRRRA